MSQQASQLIQQGKVDEVEALWMARLESGTLGDMDGFLETAHALRKGGERPRADALLGLLADSLKERGHWTGRLKAIKEIARLARNPGNYRKDIEEAAAKAFGDRRSFAKLREQVGLADTAANPVERLEKLEMALEYDEGNCFYMAGRGAGVVVELNYGLGVCRLDFENDKRVSIPLGAAGKVLTPLPPGHLLRAKIENPEGLRDQALAHPAETLAKLLQSFRRPMTTTEVRDAMIGIVPEARWNSWWTSARKNPQVIVSGKGAKATYSWNESTEAAEQSIRREFEQAGPRQKLELARKHSARNAEFARELAETLSKEASAVRRTDPALAWEICATLQRMSGDIAPDFDPVELFEGALAARTIASVGDRQLRERALELVRSSRPDWTRVYAEAFFFDEDPRILDLIDQALESAGEAETRTRLHEETLRYPRRHPHAFYWLARFLGKSEALDPRANYALLHQILEAITSPEFSSMRARLREMFDRGSLGIRIILSSEDSESARRLVESLDRWAGGLEDYRRDTIRTAVFMKHPGLREPQAEPVYATAEALEAKRQELEHLRKVEIPANSKALQVAREMGDLRENFEYKAARQRAEYLSARVAELQSELARVRVIDPAEVDTSIVRIGTRIALRNGDVQREVTILGPWESDPERGIYSNQSDAARALLGLQAGEIVTFLGNDYEIISITAWK